MVAQPFFWRDRVTFHYFFAGELHKLQKSNRYCYNYEIKSVCTEKEMWLLVLHLTRKRHHTMSKDAVWNVYNSGRPVGIFFSFFF